MKLEQTELEGCFLIESKVFEDERGYFFESYNHAEFEKAIGKKVNFVQDNESYSSKGVLRGLHFQKGEFAQAKLVRVTSGEVLDIVVDFRKDSATYLQHYRVVLSGENKRQLFIPRGFAHGFVVLSETAVFNYKCDNYYNKESEGGIKYNDELLNLDWVLKEEDLIVSEKDRLLPTLRELK